MSPKKIIQSKPTTIPERVTSPVSPPGSGSIEHFTDICTACHLCVSACPSRVLMPSFVEFGFLGMMQPRMNFHAGHCNYECTICMNVCHIDAILPLTVENKKLTQLDVAKFIKENCVVYTDNTDCGACSEHCPTKAVDMVPYPHMAIIWRKIGSPARWQVALRVVTVSLQLVSLLTPLTSDRILPALIRACESRYG